MHKITKMKKNYIFLLILHRASNKGDDPHLMVLPLSVF